MSSSAPISSLSSISHSNGHIVNVLTRTELCAPAYSTTFSERFVPRLRFFQLVQDLTVLSKNFVSLAFTAARAADSTAKYNDRCRIFAIVLTRFLRLYINDYNLDSNNAKVQGMVALVKRVNSAGTLIDAIGTQMHLSVSLCHDGPITRASASF